MADHVKLLSSISTPLLQRSLVVASIQGSIAGVLLLFSGTWLPLEELSNYGLLVFTLVFLLLAKGVIPYKKLVRMSTHPHKLVINSNGFAYFTKKHPAFTVPFSAINSISFIKTEKIYGIAIFFKDQLEDKIRVHSPRFSMSRFQKKSFQDWGCPLFIPYFSMWSSKVLKEHWEASLEPL